MAPRTRTPYQDRARQQRTATDADDAEFVAVLRGSTVADAGVYDDRVAGAMDDFAQNDDEAVGSDIQHRDLEADNAVGAVQEELERRSKLLGGAYPFRLEENRLIYEGSRSGVYEFCLAASLAKDFSTQPFAAIPRVFERISALIVRRYLGEGAKSLHVGAPRDADVGITFKRAMERLHELSGEWRWGPDEDLPDEHLISGDDHLDFVVWKPLVGDQPGKLFLIGQCACGTTNWADKLNELNPESLRKWFNPMTVVPPVRCFTTPFTLSEGNLRHTQREAGLIFDRARLAALAEMESTDEEVLLWTEGLRCLAKLVIKQ